MKKLIFFAGWLVLFFGCSPQPQPIQYGMDKCHSCKMTIVDAQHAAEAVTHKGKAYKFDAIECMVHFVNNKPEQEYAYLLVNDFHQPKELIDAMASAFLISPNIRSPMGANLSAFRDQPTAQQMKEQYQGRVLNWSQLLVDLGNQEGTPSPITNQ